MRQVSICFLLMISMAVSGALGATPDVNLDESVDVVDVQTTINLILGQSQAAWTGQGDVNADQTVDVVDVQLLVNEILGIPSTALTIPNPGPVLTLSVGRPLSRRVFALGGGGSQLTFSLGPGAPSWLSVSPSGVLSGTPLSVGQAAFILQVSSGGAPVSRPIVFDIINRTPVVKNEMYFVMAGTTFSTTTTGVLLNDFDEDGHSLTATKTMDPLVGSATLLSNGYLLYTVPTDAEGVHGMAYEVSDGYGGVARGSVKFVIVPQAADEVRSEDLIFPGIVKSGMDMAVTFAIRAPAGITVVAATARIEGAASIAALVKRAPLAVNHVGEFWEGVLTTTGIAPGVHKVILTATHSGGGEVERVSRVFVHSGNEFRVGPGAYATFSAARSASGVGDVIVFDPGEITTSSTFGNVITPPDQGLSGCAHGSHAFRIVGGPTTTSVFVALSSQSQSVFGVTFIQYAALCVRVMTSATGWVVECEFLGTKPTPTTYFQSVAINQLGGTLHLLGCTIRDWSRELPAGSTSSNGAAINIVSFGKAILEDCVFLRLRFMRQSTNPEWGGAISVDGNYGNVDSAGLSVTRCSFIDCSYLGNFEFYGGAIGVSNGRAVVTDSEFVDCVCEPRVSTPQPGVSMFAGGGAIAAKQFGVVDIYRCRFTRNGIWADNLTTFGSVTALGGVLYCGEYSTMVADQCMFDENWLWQTTGNPSQLKGVIAAVQYSSALRIENSEMRGNAPYGATSLPVSMICVNGPERNQTGIGTSSTRLILRNVLAVENRGSSAAHFIDVERPVIQEGSPAPILILTFCTVAGALPAIENGQVTGTLIRSVYGSATMYDNVFWEPSIPSIMWTGGGNVTVLNSAVGPAPMTGVTASNALIFQDPMLATGGSWLLTSNSPGINAGTGLSQVFGFSMRTALDSLAPDVGQVDLGYHAPMPQAGPFPFTTMNAYLQAHQFALHSAYSAAP